jgi:Uncharacterized ACR, COG1678
VRMPLEVELRRNYRHSRSGQRLRQKLQARVDRDRNRRLSTSKSSNSGEDEDEDDNATNLTVDGMDLGVWYSLAQQYVEDEMTAIADTAADSDGVFDASLLKHDTGELLQLYLDHQENWQEVCLVLELDDRTATTLVLNRPMALKLTPSLAQLVLHGDKDGQRSSRTRSNNDSLENSVPLQDFLRAFGSECAVYVGGPDDQDAPAVLLHGVADLPGSREVAPGLYQGGVRAAVCGVLTGKYRPLEFRFFVGCHKYGAYRADEDKFEENLRVQVLRGKYQQVACARSLALKQCIQLPKPLWHEVLELCGKELADISSMELLKRDDLRIQIVDDEEEDDDEDEYYVMLLDDDEIPDELDELFDDDDDDSGSFYSQR